MKKLFVTLSIIAASLFAASAQGGVAYINTETVLSNLDEYKTAQESLTAYADKYKAAIETEVGNIDALYRDYMSKKSSYSAAKREEIEKEIIQREKDVKAKQDIYFGSEGVMNTRTEATLKPIKAKVQKAIDIVAKKRGATLVIDLAIAPGVVYKDEASDLTAEVMALLNKSEIE